MKCKHGIRESFDCEECAFDRELANDQATDDDEVYYEWPEDADGYPSVTEEP